MTLQYMNEYQALGVGYRETFADLATARSKLLQRCKVAYPASLDSKLFTLSRSELIGNESECISEFDENLDMPTNARIRVTDTTGVTETVLFCNLLAYLQKRADAVMERDLPLWGVWRKVIDSETATETWESVYTALLADVRSL